MSVFLKQTGKRVASALIGLPFYLAAIITDYFYGVPVLILSIFISIAALYEFYQIADRDSHGKPVKGMGIFFGVLINLLMYVFAFGKIYGYTSFIGEFDARAVMALFIIFLALVQAYQLFKRPINGSAYSIGITLAGLMIIVLPFSHIILLKSLKNGVYYIILMNIIVMINDTFAYLGGSLFGRHKTNFAVSPNKSWEGYFSGLLFSLLFSMISNQFIASFFNIHLFSMAEAAILGIFFSLVANIGDLSESLFKRDSGVKDSGSIIPGHGGMWDTFDALIFAMPLFYYYLVAKGVH